MTRNPLPNYIPRTGAHFETQEGFKKASIIANSTDQKLEKAGIPMMRVAENTYAMTKQELHTFVIGDSGSGKTRRVIFPSIRMLQKTGQSMVISDPKGEIYRKTSQHLKKDGYDVFIMNFRNPTHGNSWNPLDIIEKYYRSKNQGLKDKASSFLRDIGNLMTKNVHSDNDVFWEQAASSVFMGVSLLLLKYGYRGSLTFENIAYVAQVINSEKESNKKYDSDSLCKQIIEMEDPDEAKAGIIPLIDAPSETANSIMSVFNTMLSPFINNSSIKMMLSSTDFDINQLGVKPTALFLVLPDDSSFFYQIATIMVKQIYSTLVNQADLSVTGKLKNPVSFILDEFANFTPIDDFDAMLTAGRSRGINFTLVCQSMYQLEKKYGNTGANILMDNCRVWIYLNSRNTNFLSKLVSLIGYRRSPYTGETIPLIDVVELQHLEFGETLVLNDRCYPMMGYLPDFSEYDFGDGLVNDEMCDFPEEKEMTETEIINIERLKTNMLGTIEIWYLEDGEVKIEDINDLFDSIIEDD